MLLHIKGRGDKKKTIKFEKPFKYYKVYHLFDYMFKKDDINNKMNVSRCQKDLHYDQKPARFGKH